MFKLLRYYLILAFSGQCARNRWFIASCIISVQTCSFKTDHSVFFNWYNEDDVYFFYNVCFYRHPVEHMFPVDNIILGSLVSNFWLGFYVYSVIKNFTNNLISNLVIQATKCQCIARNFNYVSLQNSSFGIRKNGV